VWRVTDMPMKSTTVAREKSGGNVFADLRLPHPEQELLEACLTLQIYRNIKARVPTRNSVGTRRNSRRRDQGRRHADHRIPALRCWPLQRRPRSGVDTPRRTTLGGGKLSMAPRATIRRRDVRNDDASRRGAGSGRSCRRSAVASPAGRAHPCPARDAFATGGSRRDTAGGGGAGSVRSTR